MSTYKKYYLALAGNELRSVYTQEDLDFFSSHDDTRSPFEIFSGDAPEEQVTDIFVCELTNSGLTKRKKLNEQLEEENL